MAVSRHQQSCNFCNTYLLRQECLAEIFVELFVWMGSSCPLQNKRFNFFKLNEGVTGP